MTQWMAITISTMYGYLLWMVTHYGWHNVRYYCWHNVWLLWIAQCMATYHGRLPTMYGTMYATIVGTMYGYPNVQLWLLCLRRINSSQYQVTSKCMTHFSVRSLWCTCHWDVRIGMDESRVGHQCDQIWANFATLVNFCSRWPNILSSFSAWQIMNLLWNFFTVYGNFSLI